MPTSTMAAGRSVGRGAGRVPAGSRGQCRIGVEHEVHEDGSHETQANRRTIRSRPVRTDESLPGSLVSWMADTESELILGTPS